MSHGIIDAKMDQLNDKVIIKTTMVRHISNEEWLKIRANIKVWKQRFQTIEKVLLV